MAISETSRIVNLVPGDVVAGMALSTEAGWNQTVDDWLHFIVNGKVIGIRNAEGLLVATAAALPYDGPFGFIGMVLVTQNSRRRGLATRLVDQCIAELKSGGLTPVLDATAAGAEVYRRQGFLPQFGFDRWEGQIAGVKSEAGPAIAPARIAGLDAAAFGAVRTRLLEDFLGRDGSQAVLADTGDGFALIRSGRRALQAGPVVASSEVGALDLLRSLFASTHGTVFIDVPSIWRDVAKCLADSGFTIQRSFTRMALGRSEPYGEPRNLFAVAGPEFG